MKSIIARFRPARIIGLSIVSHNLQQEEVSLAIQTSGRGRLWVSSADYRPAFVRLLQCMCWPIIRRSLRETGVLLAIKVSNVNGAVEVRVPSGSEYRVRFFSLYSFDRRNIAVPARTKIVERESIAIHAVPIKPARLNLKAPARLHRECQFSLGPEPSIDAGKITALPTNFFSAHLKKVMPAVQRFRMLYTNQYFHGKTRAGSDNEQSR